LKSLLFYPAKKHRIIIFENIVEIQFSKKKLMGFMLLSLGITALGTWTAFFAEDMELSLLGVISINNTILGICFIALGLGTSYIFIKRMTAKHPALIFGRKGFVHNTTSYAIKDVLWEDVEALDQVKVANQKFLSVRLRNAETYLDTLSGTKKKMLMINYKRYGTPVLIPVSNLNISYDQLHETILSFMENSKEHTNSF